MKRYFSLYNVFIVCIVYTSIAWADQSKDDYTHILCELIPIARDLDRDASNDRVSRNESISHPYIPGPKPLDIRLPKKQTTSTNWCGYVAASNLTKPVKNSVTAVFGSWIVPVVEPANKDTYAAFWIGIDGYTSPTVEQIGTSHDFVGGMVRHYAWFEMYPASAYLINGFPLQPGDVISASVKYSGNNVFILTISNNTQKVSTTIPTSYTRSTTAQRSCAEWVVEAPWLNGVLPLTDFITGYLWGCMATINGVTGSIKNAKWANTSIAMVSNTGQSKAIPSSLLQDQGSFFVTWFHQ